MPDEGALLVSVDNVHQPFSTSELREAPMEHELLLQCFAFDTNGWSEVTGLVHVESINRHGSFEITKAASGQLGDVLYTLETIRKRGFE